MGKLELVNYEAALIIKNDMLSRVDRMTDGRTDKRTDMLYQYRIAQLHSFAYTR